MKPPIVIIDYKMMVVKCGRVALRFDRREWQLIDYLSRHPNQPKTRDQIMDAIYGEDVAYNPEVINRHICGVRRRMKHHFGTARWLKAVQGIGYEWVPDGPTNIVRVERISPPG